MDVKNWLEHYVSYGMLITGAEYTGDTNEKIERLKVEKGIIDNAIGTLPEDYMTLILSHYVHKYSFAYIAKTYRKAKSTIFSKTKRAIEMLDHIVNYQKYVEEINIWNTEA